MRKLENIFSRERKAKIAEGDFMETVKLGYDIIAYIINGIVITIRNIVITPFILPLYLIGKCAHFFSSDNGPETEEEKWEKK